jgi:hypothetical protein
VTGTTDFVYHASNKTHNTQSLSSSPALCSPLPISVFPAIPKLFQDSLSHPLLSLGFPSLNSPAASAAAAAGPYALLAYSSHNQNTWGSRLVAPSPKLCRPGGLTFDLHIGQVWSLSSHSLMHSSQNTWLQSRRTGFTAGSCTHRVVQYICGQTQALLRLRLRGLQPCPVLADPTIELWSKPKSQET